MLEKPLQQGQENIMQFLKNEKKRKFSKKKI